MLKKIIKKAVVWAVVSSLISIAIIPFGKWGISAVGISLDDEGVEEGILSQQDAVLQKYSIEDIIATQSFILCRPYDGTGRVIDANEDNQVDVFDLCIMKREHKEIGNYYDLLFKFNQNNKDQYSVSSEDGEFVSNRVLVKTTHEFDFSEFAPTSVLGDSEYHYLLQFDTVSEADYCVNSLKSREDIVYAQMDGYVEIPPEDIESTDTNELQIESSSLSWGVSVIEADQYASYLAQNFTGQVTVAVIDSGVANHSFLNGRVLSGGIDTVNNDYDPKDDNGHGTHVAGTIVDCTPGLNINILPIKVLDANGSGSDQNVIDGIKWARDSHVDVINLSLGPDKRVPQGGAFECAVNEAIADGIIVVKAAGNEDDDTKYRSPANSKASIVVASIDSSLNRSVFKYGASNYGESVDVAAPGSNIKSSTYDGGYGYKSGTSMATPHIAAAAAMIKYQYPNYTPAQVEDALVNTCKDLGTSGKDIYYGYGVPKLSKLIKSSSPPPAISLSSKSAVLYKGQKFTLSASVTPGDVYINWTTSDSSVATVSNGVVTANSEGTAIITAFFTYNGTNYSATCSITVKKPGITLSESSKTVYQTNTFKLTADTLPTNQTVFWSTSNSSVATVSNGNVTAVNPGTTTITASFTYEGEMYSASCNVTVKEVSVKLDQTSKTVYQTDEFTLNATAIPAGQTISWSSSDSSIAKVSNGRVTAVNPGTANITASFVYGGKTFSASCTVTVKKVSIELSTHSKSLIIGDTSTISAVTSPSGLTVSWESENNMVASVSAGKITAKAPGSITIKATMTYNGKEYSDSCSVTVVEPSVKLSRSQVKISKNETFKLSAETLPSGQTITWKSEDTNICSVDSNGTVTGKSIGNTMVYATITYGGVPYTDSCNVIVGEPKVTLNKSSMTMYVSDTQTLVASVVAVDGIDISSETRSDITWTSDKPSIATVSSNGSVAAVSAGTATITATYSFCGVKYSATCTVTVQGKPGITLNQSSRSMYIGDTYTLTASVTPSNATVTWSSSDSSKVTVNSNGKVSAISNGTATVTASIRYNGVTYYADCKFTVEKPSISLSASSLYGFVRTDNNGFWLGDSATVTKSGKIPSGATVSWSSSNTGVATVDSSGTLKGVGGGTAKITASFTYGGNKYSASINVTVLTLNSVRTFTVSPTSGSNNSTVFSMSANVGFVASKVTIQICSTSKSLQSNGAYDYTTYTGEINMSKQDASHWTYNTTLSGFSSGTYIVRCRAYNGSSSTTATVQIKIN